MTLEQAQSQLVAAGKRLLAEGLVARSWGNLSVRLNDDTMAVTPSGILWDDVIPEQISVVNLSTGEWTGAWKPSGERKVHRAIYAERPDVHAIIHTHQNAASVLAAARQGVDLGAEFIACAPYALPSTKALTRKTVGALGSRSAVLMANHGVFVVAATLDEAFERVRRLEERCASVVATRSPGLPAAVDAPWQADWMTLVPTGTLADDGTLADGSEAWLSQAPFTRAWADTGRPLPAVLDDLAQLAGVQVPVAQQIPQRRPRKDVVLVAGQGALVTGPDAVALALVVEKTCRALLGGRGFGGARAFPKWEAALMHWVYRQSYSKQAIPAGASRARS